MILLLMLLIVPFLLPNFSTTVATRRSPAMHELTATRKPLTERLQELSRDHHRRTGQRVGDPGHKTVDPPQSLSCAGIEGLGLW